MDLTSTWTGVAWGNVSGLAVFELASSNGTCLGHLRLVERGGTTEADFVGTVSGLTLTGKLANFRSSEFTGLPATGSVVATLSSDYMQGEWKSDAGPSGLFALLRHEPASTPDAQLPESPVRPTYPSTFVTKNLELGCYRLDQEQLQNLCEVVHRGTNVPAPALSVSWDGRTVTKLNIADLAGDPGVPNVVSDVTIAVNEPWLGKGTRSIFLNFKGRDANSLVVTGEDPTWVEGRAAEVKSLLRQSEMKAVRIVRKYGNWLNSLIFLFLLALLPSVRSLWQRSQVVLATFALLFTLLFLWQVPKNTKIFLRNAKPSWWERNGSSLLLTLLSVALSGLIGYLTQRYVR